MDENEEIEKYLVSFNEGSRKFQRTFWVVIFFSGKNRRIFRKLGIFNLLEPSFSHGRNTINKIHNPGIFLTNFRNFSNF